MRIRRTPWPLIVAVLVSAGTNEVPGADSRGAERHYKVARRLVAERSPEAAAALAKVFELDPEGPLADDASVESALLVGIARWPEELGEVVIEDAARAKRFLERVTIGLPDSDRVTEAWFYRALQLLEPIAGRNESAARLDLIILSDSAAVDKWSSRARYARAWIDEHQGKVDGAFAAYHRLVIDDADSAVTARALAGLGRVALGRGRHAEAAAHFDAAARAGAPEALASAPLRELAVRALLASVPGAAGESEIVAAGTGIRSIGGWVALGVGDVVMADRRGGEVHRYRANGSVAARWNLPGLQAVAADPLGRLYAAAGEAIFRLVEGEAPRRVVTAGDFGAVSAIAADAAGRFYLLDKRGGSVAVVEPGAGSPGERWEGYSSKFSALAWAGDRLLALDSRGKRVVSLGPGGAVRTIADGFEKPQAFAVDRAGGIAVIDGRSGAVSFFDRDGALLGSWVGPRAGVLRPAAVAYSDDGTLQLFDEANETWVRLP